MSNLLDFCIKDIFRSGMKNTLIMVIFTILVTIISTVVLINSSLIFEYKGLIKSLPDILMIKSYGGRDYLINESELDKFYKIKSIKSITPRVFGEHFFERDKIYATIFGIKEFSEYSNEIFNNISNKTSLNNEILISKDMYNALKNQINEYKSVVFFTPNDGMISIKNFKIFDFNNSVYDSDLIITNENLARKILGIPNNLYTDALIDVANPNEVDFLVQKLRISYPKFKFISKDDMMKSYEGLYSFKSGWFLALFLIAIVTFGIILYDKASGFNSVEKKQIAILKALGYEISDIINIKLIQSLIISNCVFFIGLNLAMFWVYFCDGWGLKLVFIGLNNINLRLDFVFDFKIFALLFIICVIPYIAVCIIPAYKLSIIDTGELLR